MTQEQQELRRINWTEIFSFTHIFKSFKMAYYPHQWALATVAVVLVFCLGWSMDWVWSLADQYVAPDEIGKYFAQPLQFDEARDQWKKERAGKAVSLVAEMEERKYSLSSFQLPSGHLRDAFSNQLAEANADIQRVSRSIDEIRKGNDYDDLLDEASELFEHQIDRIERLLDKAEDAADKELANIDESKRDEAEEQLDKHLAAARQRLTELKVVFERRKLEIRGAGIFDSLIAYEQNCLGNALTAVRYANFFGGMAAYRNRTAAAEIPPMAVDGPAPQMDPPIPAGERAGFVYWVLMGANGVCWLLAEHWVFALVFLALALAVTALFGGAVNRTAALHFAREEKISALQALRFASGRFLSFYTAPLLPLAVILAAGVGLLTVGGLIGSIPFIGTLLMGLLFFLAIIVGLVIAFLLIGLVAGMPLMYPTVAVEGSDSMDAVSRSFSYVFSRPWRAGLYGFIALVYGTVTYLFVRLFAFIGLKAVHLFVGWGVFGGGSALHPAADKLDVMWNTPTFDRLFGPINWPAMSGVQPLGAFLINLWVFLVAAAVGAYLLSYAASSTTAIYFLLRRKVDATDLDDVYVEEAPEPGQAEPAGEEPAQQPAESQEQDSAPDDQGEEKS